MEPSSSSASSWAPDALLTGSVIVVVVVVVVVVAVAVVVVTY